VSHNKVHSVSAYSKKTIQIILTLLRRYDKHNVLRHLVKIPALVTVTVVNSLSPTSYDWGGSKYADTPLVAPSHRVLCIVVRRWTLTCRLRWAYSFTVWTEIETFPIQFSWF